MQYLGRLWRRLQFKGTLAEWPSSSLASRMPDSHRCPSNVQKCRRLFCLSCTGNLTFIVYAPAQRVPAYDGQPWPYKRESPCQDRTMLGRKDNQARLRLKFFDLPTLWHASAHLARETNHEAPLVSRDRSPLLRAQAHLSRTSPEKSSRKFLFISARI